MQAIMEWISKNFETWKKICRVNKHEFDESELMNMLKEISRLSSKNPYFHIIFIVILTEYEKELSFLEDE